MALPLKPPARAARVRPLRTRGTHTVLTSQVIEDLFRDAEVLTEGGLAGSTWYGSVLITFELARVCDEAELDRVADAIAGSVRVRILAHRLARAHLHERYPDRRLGTAHVESRFRRVDGRLLLDVDLEAPIEVASSRRRVR